MKDLSKSYQGFELVNECEASNSVPIRKYVSWRSGLTIVTADIPGPLVHGCAVIATEAEDDDGLPHTLEHLTFLGSADYPFKGCLDMIANRCLADGTNAWTVADHTAYTVSTAGSEGFLTLLPVYLDHLFFPTLTDSGFVTEVYHITGEGKDAGVVLCEVQSVETMAERVAYVELSRALYDQKCGYRHESGGLVSNIRNSTSMDKIRKFHRRFYCPKNTTIFVVGLVPVEELIHVVAKFEEKLIGEGLTRFEKAWQKEVEKLDRPIIRAITYPSDHEDNGTVLIGWHGLSISEGYYNIVAIRVLLTYLTDTSASPLMKYFVEMDNPYCSEVDAEDQEFSTSMFWLTFNNVSINKISSLPYALIDLLHVIANNTNKDWQIDLNRMNSVIQRFALRQTLNFEKSPLKEIVHTLIGGILYEKGNENMYHRLNHQKLAVKLASEPLTFWTDLLKRYFLNGSHAVVLGYPWKNENKLRSHFESERICQRKLTLGDDGLQQKADILKKASEENERCFPDELIASVPLPSVDKLQFLPIQRYTSISETQHPKLDLSSTPVFTQLDNVQSKFLYIYFIMDSSKLDLNLRWYLPLFLEYILSCPVRRNDRILSYEDVSLELEQDLISIESCMGVKYDNRFACGGNRFACEDYSFAATLRVEALPENFEKSINWIRELLRESVFSAQRIKTVAQKLIQSISQTRREGSIMVKHLTKLMLFNSDTNHKKCAVLSQSKFLSELVDELQDPEQLDKVINDLETVRLKLTQPENVILHLSVAVNELLDKFDDPALLIAKIVPENEIYSRKRLLIPQDNMYLRSTIKDEVKSCVVGMATADNSYLCHSMYSIREFYDPDLPALLVFIQFLIQLEGPMWKEIRGYGLAYGYTIVVKPNEGVMQLILFRATDVAQAFRRTKDICNEYVESAGNWNNLCFESAKNSLIFELVNQVKNVPSVCVNSIFSYLNGTSEDYNRTLIKKINSLQQSDMKSVGRKYITSMFVPKNSLTTVICHSTKCKEIAEAFSKIGFELQQFETLDESYMSPTVDECLK